MKIQVISDLHLEFEDYRVKNEGADVLVLSGDICQSVDLYKHPAGSYSGTDLGSRQKAAKRYREFFARVTSEFDEVVYVAGNHEFYHGKWAKTHEVLHNEASAYTNLHYLEREVFVYKGVTFLGATMWTNMGRGDPLTLHAVRDMMNDYSVILDDTRGFTKLKPATTATLHRDTLGYFNAVLAGKIEDKFVVVTHHAPCFESVNARYKFEWLMNNAYASDLSEFILDRPQIKLWTHGHMHDPVDYFIGNTRVVCNPKGYPSELNNFVPAKVIEV